MHISSFSFSNTGIQRDVTLYNGLLSVYIQNNHKFSPLEVLEQMQENSVEPNRVRGTIKLGMFVNVSLI